MSQSNTATNDNEQGKPLIGHPIDGSVPEYPSDQLCTPKELVYVPASGTYYNDPQQVCELPIRNAPVNSQSRCPMMCYIFVFIFLVVAAICGYYGEEYIDDTM